jgi:RNA polymerase sigma-54 factor
MLNQKLQQKLLQKLSPQQIQVIKLFEIPALMLEQRIKAEIEENPALELEEDFESDTDEPIDNESDESESETSEEGEETDSESEFEIENDEQELNAKDDLEFNEYYDEDEYSNYKFNNNNGSPDQDNKEIPFSVGNTFQEFLENQLGLQEITEEQRTLAMFLIGNIDEDGYLRRELENIVDDIAFKQSITTNEQELENVLKIIQRLDPAGIGARNLQECLLLQIDRKDLKKSVIKIAKDILKHCFNEFTKKHYDKIIDKLDIGEETLKMAISEIVKLNPKPGSSFSDPMNKQDSSQTIIPDFILEDIDGQLELSLSSRNMPDLKVSRTYMEMLREYKNPKMKGRGQKEAVTFVRQKIESAKWFIDAMKQRQYTLLNTMQAIVDIQSDYFKTGDETKLKPMILKDIAEITGLDVSTVSRVASSKHVQTNFGVFQLKYFFSEGLQNDEGEEVSSREIKQIIQDLIKSENKRDPFTDDGLGEELKIKGYIIARRTIAKYREQLNIPVGRLRKEL